MENIPTKMNNPGDIKDSATGTFKQFADPKQGYAALLNDIQAKINGSHGLGKNATLADFANVYAPSSDNNNSGKYAADLANKLGVRPDTTLGELEPRIGDLANAISGNEGFHSAPGFVSAPPIAPETVPTNPLSPFDAPQEQPSNIDNSDVFHNPLQNIATGNSGKNVDFAKGALKQGLADISQAGAQNAGPVGAAMLANAPEFAKNIDSFRAATAPVGQEQNQGAALTQLGEAVLPTGAGTLKTAAGISERALANKTLESVMPRLTPKVAATIGKTNPTGIMGTISAKATPWEQKIAKTVKGIFNPKSFSQSANNAEQAAIAEAKNTDSVIAKVNHPYIYRELESTLNKTEIPHFIKTSDAVVQRRAQAIIDKFMEIARSKDGTVSSLMDARREFSQWAKQEYPKVYDDGNFSAIQKLVSNIRKASKEFIVKQVPSAGVDASLEKQNLLYDARDIWNEKAAIGDLRQQGEIGTNRFGRWAARNPVKMGLAKKAGGVALLGAGLGTGATAYNDIKGLFSPSQ